MTPSMQEPPPPALHRRLPNPATDHVPALHRTSSLSHHHLFHEQPADHGHNDAGARRNTVQLSQSSNSDSNDRGDLALRSISNAEYAVSMHSERGHPGGLVDERSQHDSNRSMSYSREHVCLCPPDPKIPRPRNSFILFRQHQQGSIIAQNPGIPNPEVSKIIGEQWRRLSTEAKEEWNMLAEAEKARHQEQYPGYRYHPRRNGRVGNQSSVSGPSSAEPQEPCSKCGGKPIQNSTAYSTSPAPNNPQQNMAAQVPSKRGYFVSASHGQRVHGQPTPEHLAQQKSFVEAYPFTRVDPRLIYAVPPTAQHTPPSDSQDPKRRRYNSNGVYVSAGQPYPESTYAYPHSPINNAYTRGEAMQQVHASQMPVQRVHSIQTTKPAMISPPRGVYPRPPQLQPVRPPHPQQRARSTVALPPIETVLAQTPIKTSSTSSQSSGVEAMIMSIPVLNKVKVLSQISSPLPAPGLTSPKPEVRGAIIAIEGMNAASVNSMTASLAEQLEKEGNFAVKIFDGPDPYSLIRAARQGGPGHYGNITTETYLQMLSEWHKINKETVEYITTRPGSQVASGSRTAPIALDSPSFDREPKTPSKTIAGYPQHGLLEALTPASDVPQSAISPKIIHKAAELSIVSPPPAMKGRSQSTPGGRPSAPVSHTVEADDNSNGRNGTIPAPLTFPRPLNSNRIPPPLPTPSNPQHISAPRALSRVPPPRFSEQGLNSSAPTATQPSGESQSQVQDKGNEAHLSQTSTSTAIPIALIPHFQLTTVDASSISMPISDGFSPPAHWQWFATLWRGSVGPDVTIVIKSTDEDVVEGTGTDASARIAASGTNASATPAATTVNQAASAGPPSQNQAARDRASAGSIAGLVTGGPGSLANSTALPTTSSTSTSPSGVEIRLNDCRAVVVKTGIIPSSSSSGGVGSDALRQVNPKELDYWEKAKRRVGFEVEEFLRR